MLVAATIPARVVMHCIADIVARDGVGFIVRVARLPSRAGHPYDTREAIGPDAVYYRLEEVVQRLRVLCIARIFQTHRLVCQLNADLTRILADRVILREQVPHVQEIFLVVVAHLQIAWTDSRRTYDNIHAMLHRLLHQREVKRFQVRSQPSRVEMLDVCFAGSVVRLTRGDRVRIVVVVGPCRLQVQAEHIAVRSLQARVELLEISQTPGAALVVVAPAPSSAVEPCARRVHDTVQNYVVAVRIHQPFAFYMECGQWPHTLSRYSGGY